MQTAAAILESISTLSSVDGYSNAVTLLNHPEARLQSEFSDRGVTVGTIDPVWRSRLQIALDRGFEPAAGLQFLVQSFDRMNPDTVLHVASVETEHQAGSFWFAEQTGSPVGFVVVDRGRNAMSRPAWDDRLPG